MGILKQTLSLAIKVWYTTFLIFTAGFIIAVNYKSFVDNDFDDMIVLMTIGCLVASSIGSLPALVAMQLILPLIKRFIKYPLYSISM